MNAATPSLSPQPANDRPARPAIFTTKDGADSYARRLARAESPTGAITRPAYFGGIACFQPVQGGDAYEVRLLSFGDFEVRLVTEHELVRRQQAGMRAEIVRQLERAAEWQADGDKSRMGSVRAEFHRYARECRERAREIEGQLTLSGVRKIELSTSSERDSREAIAR